MRCQMRFKYQSSQILNSTYSSIRCIQHKLLNSLHVPLPFFPLPRIAFLLNQGTDQLAIPYYRNSKPGSSIGSPNPTRLVWSWTLQCVDRVVPNVFSVPTLIPTHLQYPHSLFSLPLYCRFRRKCSCSTDAAHVNPVQLWYHHPL